MVAETSCTSQGLVANRVGVAVGIVNATMKRCAAKSWVMMERARTPSGYLMQEGLAEKGRLTSECLSCCFSHVCDVHGQRGVLFADCAARGWLRLASCGLSDLTDVAILSTQEAGVELVVLVDPGADRTHSPPLPIHPVLDVPADAVVMTARPSSFTLFSPPLEDDSIPAPAVLPPLRQYRTLVKHSPPWFAHTVPSAPVPIDTLEVQSRDA